LFIPQDAIEELFSKSMLAVKNYIAFLAGRVQFLNRKIEGFTLDGATQRLAMYLIDHSDTDGKVALPFGMNKLAAQLSIGRASLYRAEQILVQKGLIERSGRMIHILSLELLSHIWEEQS
jgi:CRP-like cAMP-binding protein